MLGAGNVIAIGGFIEIIAGIGILIFTQLARARRSDLIKKKLAQICSTNVTAAVSPGQAGAAAPQQ